MKKLLPTRLILLYKKNRFNVFEQMTMQLEYNHTAKKRIFSLFLALMVSLFAQSQTDIELKTVVIDAGHGGKD
ncbi:MAG: hypothetical protein ACLGGV_06295, partial [Bacteroidia bacterium]